MDDLHRFIRFSSTTPRQQAAQGVISQAEMMSLRCHEHCRVNNYSFLSGGLFKECANRDAMLVSIRFVAALSAVERAKVDEQIRALIATEPELRGKDVVTVPYVTAAFVAVKAS
jgi:hypothetical protein